MAKLLLVNGSLAPPGGGNAVAAWAIQSLARRHAVHVLTCVPPNLTEADEYFGTNLQSLPLTFSCWPAAIDWFDRALPFPHELLRLSLLQRWARQLGRGFDLTVWTWNEAALGRPALQYIHYPWSLHPRPDAQPQWYQSRWRKFILFTYYAFCHALSGFSPEETRRNRTLVNSDWTGRLAWNALGVNSRTLFPPAALPRGWQALPWEQREDRFLLVGRISPEKRIEEAVAILEEVRARGFPVKLTVVGNRDHPGYAEQIARLIQPRPWVQLRENLTRAQLAHLWATSRYGIHAMQEEHFGMAVAELVRAGCLVFVPDGGGQVEIVERHPQLVWSSRSQAVKQIVDVLGNPELQQELLAHLGRQREKLSESRFAAELLEEVEQLLASRPKPAEQA